MRSRTRNIIDAVLVVALAVACVTAINLRTDSADKSRTIHNTQKTVSSLATQSQANFGKAHLLEQEQLAERTTIWNSENNIAAAASTLTQLGKMDAPINDAIPTLEYYARAILAGGKAWTQHVIPGIYLGSDVVDLGTVYHLSAGTSWDGQPAIYVTQVKQG
jgi:hypothetical protein